MYNNNFNNNQSTSKYFRITAYHPKLDVTIIMDSNGKFDKLWQFSAYMIEKSFKILEVANSDNFQDDNIEKAEYDTTHIFLRANQSGKITSKNITKNGIEFTEISVENETYYLVKNT